jgi:ribosomal protein S18 acetylase RimI-like enzyme
MVSVDTLGDDRRKWVSDVMRERWGDTIVVAHGVVYEPSTLSGFIATDDRRTPAGLLTYAIDGDACEIVTIDAFREREGTGTALIEAVAAVARQAGCRRLWLITTNDNDRAQAFYRARGFQMMAVHEGAVDASRAMKPSIPFVDGRGVSISDEIEYALAL